MQLRKVLKRRATPPSRDDLVATSDPVGDKGAGAALENQIGGLERWFDWRGRWVAFTQRGEGPPLVLVHGLHAAASSFEWRHVVDPLSANHTVYTIDLLGFGRSARPNIRYTPWLYESLLGDFAARVVGEPCTLVANSRAAAYSISLAARDPVRFPALIVIQPTGLVRPDAAIDRASGLERRLLTLPLIGTGLFNAQVTRERLREYLERAYVDDDLVTDALIDPYFATAHRTGARFAPAALRSGLLEADVSSALRRLPQPMLLVWGARARIAPVDESLGFRALKPDTEVAIIDGAGDLPQDERPQLFLDAAMAFLDGVRAAVAQPRDRPGVSLKETA
jgi:pimeloyl-ACP methyl ester carboxylesterase